MDRMTLRDRGQLTLPGSLRRATHLEPGDVLEAEITPDGILLRPRKLIDVSQAWFWTPEWQAGERGADADRDAGQVETFDSGEEMIAALRRRQKRLPSRRRRT